MNERIQELSTEAWDYADKHDRKYDNHGWLYRDKFAELILKECLILFEEAKVNQEDDVDYGLEEAKNIIKEHFGVEE